MITLHHQDGLAEYKVTRSQYGFIDNELYVEIEAVPKTDHHLSFLSDLSLELNGIPVDESHIKDSSGTVLKLPRSVNEDDTSSTDRFTDLYLGEHYDVDENTIQISAPGEREFHLEWKGIAPDARYYDEKAKPMKIEVRTQIGSGLFPEQT